MLFFLIDKNGVDETTQETTQNGREHGHKSVVMMNSEHVQSPTSNGREQTRSEVTCRVKREPGGVPNTERDGGDTQGNHGTLSCSEGQVVGVSGDHDNHQ